MKLKYILIMLVILSSCKEKKHSDTISSEIVTEKLDTIIKKEKNQRISLDENSEDTSQLEKRLTLNFMQGIWDGEKDINMSRACRIINRNKVLEIICIEAACDTSSENIYLEEGYIGFIKTKEKKISLNDFKDNGKYLVYADKYLKEFRFDENYRYNNELKLYETTLSSEYMSSTVYYGRFNKQDTAAIFYKKTILNNAIYSSLKKKSKKDNRDYIKEFNIKEFSQKIKVISDKTYFYNDYELKDKRKAFLIKGDIAYLENIGNNQVQVYFDNGKSITAGYLKKSSVKILEE